MAPKMPDIAGQKFGRWTALRPSEQRVKNTFAYECRCDCGTERIVSASSLRRGETLSCGCLSRDLSRTRNRKHGLWQHRLRGTWRSMKERCYNKNHVAYPDYGGRGIKVCDRWRDSLEAFIADNEALAKHGLQIDRIDNDGDYEPGNVRWATSQQQASNRRSNHLLDFDGKRMTITEWATALSMPANVLRARIREGWSVERALTERYHPRA